jgi:hypothetical protein
LLDAANTRLRAGLDKIDEFVKIYNLPADLTNDLRRSHKVCSFFAVGLKPGARASHLLRLYLLLCLQELWRIHKGIDMNLLIDDFPKSLQMRTRMVLALLLSTWPCAEHSCPV